LAELRAHKARFALIQEKSCRASRGSVPLLARLDSLY
jgi:hypothetical protein